MGGVGMSEPVEGDGFGDFGFGEGGFKDLSEGFGAVHGIGFGAFEEEGDGSEESVIVFDEV